MHCVGSFEQNLSLRSMHEQRPTHRTENLFISRARFNEPVALPPGKLAVDEVTRVAVQIFSSQNVLTSPKGGERFQIENLHSDVPVAGLQKEKAVFGNSRITCSPAMPFRG